MTTLLRVRVVSCDAKIIGSLVGGCRITVRNLETRELLAQGLQMGGSGETETIMKTPHQRGSVIYDTPQAACFEAALELLRPTLVEVRAEGPLASPHALQSATKTTLVDSRPGRCGGRPDSGAERFHRGHHAAPCC